MVLPVLYRYVLCSKISKVRFYRTSAVLQKIVQYNLSDIGEGIREVTIRDWSVKVGDVVAQFENICSVESDKATVSITSRYDGIVTKLYYQIGEVALVGKPLVDIDVNEIESTKESTNDSFAPQKAQTQNSPELLASTNGENKTVNHGVDEVHLDSHFLNKSLATPAVRRIAKENNVLLSTIMATGKAGRVLKEDILRHIEGKTSVVITQDKKLAAETSSTSKQTGQIIKIEGIRKAMFKSMTNSHTIPTFGYCDEINMSKLIELIKDVKQRAKLKGIKLTFMPFFIKALSNALKEYPILNSSIDEKYENIIFKSSHNVGFAMDTKEGLIVPNIKNVEKLTIGEISLELKRLLEAGRELKLSPSDMTGGTITISNIGIIGGTYARPLILPPEVSIVALGKTRLIPSISENGDITMIYQLSASWTADHRIIDGATMARFSNTWKEYIENPYYLLTDL